MAVSVPSTTPPSDDSRKNATAPRPRQPWWIPPFLGRVPAGIDSHQIRLLGIVALALAFEHYDISMLGAALKDIRETFGLRQAYKSGGLVTGEPTPIALCATNDQFVSSGASLTDSSTGNSKQAAHSALRTNNREPTSVGLFQVTPSSTGK